MTVSDLINRLTEFVQGHPNVMNYEIEVSGDDITYTKPKETKAIVETPESRFYDHWKEVRH